MGVIKGDTRSLDNGSDAVVKAITSLGATRDAGSLGFRGYIRSVTYSDFHYSRVGCLTQELWRLGVCRVIRSMESNYASSIFPRSMAPVTSPDEL